MTMPIYKIFPYISHCIVELDKSLVKMTERDGRKKRKCEEKTSVLKFYLELFLFELFAGT